MSHKSYREFFEEPILEATGNVQLHKDFKMHRNSNGRSLTDRSAPREHWRHHSDHISVHKEHGKDTTHLTVNHGTVNSVHWHKTHGSADEAREHANKLHSLVHAGHDIHTLRKHMSSMGYHGGGPSEHETRNKSVHEGVVSESLKKGTEDTGRSVLKDQKTGENIFRRTTSGWHSNASHGIQWHEDMIAKHPDLANSVPHDVSQVSGPNKTEVMEHAKRVYERAKAAGFKDIVKLKHSVGKPYQDETAGYKSVTHDHTLDFHDADTGEHMGSAKFKVPYSEHGRSSDISELRHRNPDSLHVNPDYVKAHNLHDDPFKGKIDPKRDYYTGARLQDGVRPAYDEFAKLHKQKKAGKWATGTSKSEGMMSDPSHYNYDHHVSDQEALHRFTEHLRKEGVQVHAAADGKISGTDAKGKHHTVTVTNGKIHHSVYPAMYHNTSARLPHNVTL